MPAIANLANHPIASKLWLLPPIVGAGAGTGAGPMVAGDVGEAMDDKALSDAVLEPDTVEDA